MSKIIRLTQGRVSLVDDDWWELLSQVKWQFSSGYATRGYVCNGRNHNDPMHRVIMDAPKHLVVDHINGDTLDNRRENLRLCTRSQNARNCKPNKGKKYKGICKAKTEGKWEARINVRGKLNYLGTFNTQEEAALAYNREAKELFGDFYRPNIIKE